MKFELVVVGKTTNAAVEALIKDYAARLSHYTSFAITVIPELKNTRTLSEQEQKVREGEVILRDITPADRLLLLDERGKEYRSVEFAAQIDKWQQTSARRVVFCIGGPYGFSPDVYARADGMLSLSKMTFSHQMVRAFFIEQLYRAFTILRGERYHHE